MKIIKLAVISVLVLFFILTAMGLLLPSTVRVTRNINLRASYDSVCHYTGNTKGWLQWMEGIDSNTVQFLPQKNEKGNTNGKMRISPLPSTKNEVKTLWQKGNSEQLCVIQLYADTITNNTQLNWYFEQHLSWYPWQRLPAIANDKVMGPFMEQSLDKLRARVEK
jgi:hypothetical protein